MANLIVPQIQVFWGDENLSGFQLPGSTHAEPLVYNVEVTMGADNQWPTGKMEWNPTGPGFAEYERLVQNKQDDVITITFGYMGYNNGPQISFGFQYSGTEINYGVNMQVTVILACRSAAINAATRNSISNNKAEKFGDKGVDMVSMLNELNGAYTGVKPPIWTSCSLDDAKQVKVKRAQFKDQTNGAVNLNAQKELGNKILLSNIGSDGDQIIFPPYTWEAQKKCGGVVFPEPKPNPQKRYGYLLGPGIITTFNRKMEYSPPTADKSSTAGQVKAPPQPKSGAKLPATTSNKLTKAQEEAQKPNSRSVQNTSSPSNVKGFQYSENPNGPQKQFAMNEEEGVKMTADIFMCPAVTGIKPQDIVFIPSLKGDLIEDYKVTSVTYSQDGGNFHVSIQGCRTYSLSQPMYPEASKPFLQAAKNLKTLKDWEYYAWGQRLGLPPN